MKKLIAMSIGCLVLAGCPGCLSYSHYRYSKRADAARELPEGEKAKPGRIYFASFPENELAVDIIGGWHHNVGHASLVTRAECAIGYVDKDLSYGTVRRKLFPAERSAVATNDMEVAKMVLEGMPDYGNKVEIWAKDVDDIGVAERYMEQFAADEHRGSMLWRCWQIGGYRCGNIVRQAFDAARGEGHFLDLLWGGFPGADAPSIGTEKTVYSRSPAK